MIDAVVAWFQALLNRFTLKIDITVERTAGGCMFTDAEMRAAGTVPVADIGDDE